MNTFARILLTVTALAWIGYGGWLFINPAELFHLSGLTHNHWSGLVEVQAMYGGLQMALGIFALIGAVKPERYQHSALLLWTLVYSLLVVGRITGIIMWDGTFAFEFSADSLPNNYNSGALWTFEGPSAILFLIALIKTNNTK